MIKQVTTVNVDEGNGEVLFFNTKEYPSKLWKDGYGAILKPRNYSKKIYSDIRLSEIIENKQDLLRTYLLLENIYKNTNIIYAQVSKTIFRPASIEDISYILDMCLRNTKDYINRMKKIGVIAEMTLDIQGCKYSSFIFNPVYVNSCRFISNEVYLLFKPYLDAYFPQWIIDKYNELNKK